MGIVVDVPCELGRSRAEMENQDREKSEGSRIKGCRNSIGMETRPVLHTRVEYYSRNISVVYLEYSIHPLYPPSTPSTPYAPNHSGN